MESFAEKAIRFYQELVIDDPLPEEVEVMNPYLFPPVASILDSFFYSFYDDTGPRTGILGINPGRLGAGITGITFTDPVKLDEQCGIKNPFKKRPELSSTFIYDVISSFGGVEEFYGEFFLSAVCPLGFIKNGKNLNYYDDRDLEDAIHNFILATLHGQIELGLRTDRVICLGEGKNFKYLTRLNNEYRLFERIIPLPHPRWVMQYRYKQREGYVMKYIEVLRSVQAQG
jgi:hypothetical protein